MVYLFGGEWVSKQGHSSPEKESYLTTARNETTFEQAANEFLDKFKSYQRQLTELQQSEVKWTVRRPSMPENLP